MANQESGVGMDHDTIESATTTNVLSSNVPNMESDTDCKEDTELKHVEEAVDALEIDSQETEHVASSSNIVKSGHEGAPCDSETEAICREGNLSSGGNTADNSDSQAVAASYVDKILSFGEKILHKPGIPSSFIQVGCETVQSQLQTMSAVHTAMDEIMSATLPTRTFFGDEDLTDITPPVNIDPSIVLDYSWIDKLTSYTSVEVECMSLVRKLQYEFSFTLEKVEDWMQCVEYYIDLHRHSTMTILVQLGEALERLFNEIRTRQILSGMTASAVTHQLNKEKQHTESEEEQVSIILENYTKILKYLSNAIIPHQVQLNLENLLVAKKDYLETKAPTREEIAQWPLSVRMVLQTEINRIRSCKLDVNFEINYYEVSAWQFTHLNSVFNEYIDSLKNLTIVHQAHENEIRRKVDVFDEWWNTQNETDSEQEQDTINFTIKKALVEFLHERMMQRKRSFP